MSGAPVLVLLHEGLGCVGAWRDWPAVLARATGCEVFAYSRLGYGASSPATLPRPLDFMTREAHEVLPRVLEAAGIGEPVLVGHSDGGTIALLCAAAGEVSLSGVVALAAHAFNEPRCIEGIEAAREAFRSGSLRGRLARYHGERTGDTFRGWCDVWLDPEFERWSIEEELAGMRAPLLVVQGRDDPYGTLRQVEAIAGRTKGPPARPSSWTTAATLHTVTSRGRRPKPSPASWRAFRAPPRRAPVRRIRNPPRDGR